jgi:hypothetical protein
MRAEVILDTINMPVYSHGFIEDAELELRDNFYTTGPLKLHKAGSFATLNSIDVGSNWQFRVGREIVYHGNYEDEGCSEWNVNSSHEWIEELEVYEGDLALGMDNSYDAGDNYITNLEGRLKLYNDADYSLHGYIKTENAGDSEVQIRTYSGRTGGDYINMYGTSSLTGVNDWTFVWADLPELSENANFIDYRTTQYPPDSGTGYSYFDNVGLIGWTEWQDFAGTPVEMDSPNEYYYIEMRNAEPINDIRWTYTEKSYGFMPVIDNYSYYPGLQIASLADNFPNPFNPQTRLSFTLNAAATSAQFNIYNIKGQLVKKLPVNINNGKGAYAITWQGDNQSGNQAASGVYFYRLLIDDNNAGEGKCIMIK